MVSLIALNSLLESARKIRESIAGQDSVETAESLVALSLLRADQGQYQEAERLARQALAIENLRLPPDSPVRAKAMAALGNALQNAANTRKRVRCWMKVCGFSRRRAETLTDLTESLTALADAHSYLGHYSIGDSLIRRALEIDRQIYGPAHPHLADELSDLGGRSGNFGTLRRSRAVLSAGPRNCSILVRQRSSRDGMADVETRSNS